MKGKTVLQQPLVSPPGAVGRDRFDVQTCDLLLVNLLGATSVSIGTMFELAWTDAWRKPDEAIQLVSAVLLP